MHGYIHGYIHAYIHGYIYGYPYPRQAWNNLDAGCELWLSTKFVAEIPDLNPAISDRWLRIMSWTFIWQLLLSSAKDLLICRDVTGTTDVHTHYFGATFTVTANSQEQHFWDACTMTTVYRTGHGHQIRKQYLQRVSYRFCPTWIFYCPSHNVDFLNWFFSQIAINFAFTWRITRRKCAFVTQCLCAFVRLFFVLLNSGYIWNKTETKLKQNSFVSVLFQTWLHVK